jgi:hypothetical protein
MMVGMNVVDAVAVTCFRRLRLDAMMSEMVSVSGPKLEETVGVDGELRDPLVAGPRLRARAALSPDESGERAVKLIGSNKIFDVPIAVAARGMEVEGRRAGCTSLPGLVRCRLWMTQSPLRLATVGCSLSLVILLLLGVGIGLSMTVRTKMAVVLEPQGHSVSPDELWCPWTSKNAQPIVYYPHDVCGSDCSSFQTAIFATQGFGLALWVLSAVVLYKGGSPAAATPEDEEMYGYSGSSSESERLPAAQLKSGVAFADQFFCLDGGLGTGTRIAAVMAMPLLAVANMLSPMAPFQSGALDDCASLYLAMSLLYTLYGWGSAVSQSAPKRAAMVSQDDDDDSGGEEAEQGFFASTLRDEGSDSLRARSRMVSSGSPTPVEDRFDGELSRLERKGLKLVRLAAMDEAVRRGSFASLMSHRRALRRTFWVVLAGMILLEDALFCPGDARAVAVSQAFSIVGVVCFVLSILVGMVAVSIANDSVYLAVSVSFVEGRVWIQAMTRSLRRLARAVEGLALSGVEGTAAPAGALSSRSLVRPIAKTTDGSAQARLLRLLMGGGASGGTSRLARAIASWFSLLDTTVGPKIQGMYTNAQFRFLAVLLLALVFASISLGFWAMGRESLAMLLVGPSAIVVFLFFQALVIATLALLNLLSAKKATDEAIETLRKTTMRCSLYRCQLTVDKKDSDVLAEVDAALKVVAGIVTELEKDPRTVPTVLGVRVRWQMLAGYSGALGTASIVPIANQLLEYARKG